MPVVVPCGGSSDGSTSRRSDGWSSGCTGGCSKGSTDGCSKGSYVVNLINDAILIIYKASHK